MRLDRQVELARHRRRHARHGCRYSRDRIDGALADARVASMSMPLMRVCAANGTNGARLRHRRHRDAERARAPGSTIERPSGVSSASEASSAASASSRSATPGAGNQLGRHAVAEGDRAGLVEQQHVDVARGLDRAAGLRQHVELAPAGPCRRCRSPTAGRRSWSGSG